MLTERDEAGVTQWKCRVGHRYSPASLADAQAEGAEAALWAAIHTLEDRASLLTRIAEQADTRRQTRPARSFRRRAESAGEQAGLMRSVLESAASTTLRTIDADDAHDQETAA